MPSVRALPALPGPGSSLSMALRWAGTVPASVPMCCSQQSDCRSLWACVRVSGALVCTLGLGLGFVEGF